MHEEQAKAQVCKKQAISIFFGKLTELCLYLRDSVFSKDISAVHCYLYARDLAFFCLDFYSGIMAKTWVGSLRRKLFDSQMGMGFYSATLLARLQEVAEKPIPS